MSNANGQRVDEEEESTPAEFRPPMHPEVLFRTHANFGRYSIVHLGGEEYWMHGTWLALGDGQMVMVRNRVFRVSELAGCMDGITMPLPPDAVSVIS
ncbi:MAG TPA: hypothetical protein VFJ58_09025 [Armatimonadota bacterium]|nr:hypothetical protein [Armatimonadota bacterium]